MAKDKSIPSNIVLAKEKFKYDTLQNMINDVALKPYDVVETNGNTVAGDGLGAKYKIEPNNSTEKFKYDTLQNMINDVALKPYDVVETNGNTVAGDGLGAKYKIEPNNSTGAIALKNGYYAKEIIKKVDKSETYELYKNGVKTNVKVTIDENNNGIIISDDNSIQSVFSINKDNVNIKSNKKDNTEYSSLNVDKNSINLNVLNLSNLSLNKNGLTSKLPNIKGSDKDLINVINGLLSRIENVPIGTILPTASNIVPLGYLLCDGQEVDKNVYPELYNILPNGGYVSEKVFRELAKSEIPIMKANEQDNFDGQEVDKNVYPELYNILPNGGYVSEKVFRELAKSEIPIMKANEQDNFVITSSTKYNTSYEPYQAFDNKSNTNWVTANNIKTGWIKIDYPYKRAISKFSVMTSNDNGSTIKKVVLYGVNDNIEDELYNETLEIEYKPNEIRYFEIPFNKNEYQSFKIYFENNTNDPYIRIGEIELFTVDISKFPTYGQEVDKTFNKNEYQSFKIYFENNTNDPYIRIGEIELFTVDISKFPTYGQEVDKRYVPDLRNMFLRGLDVSKNRQILDYENDDNKKHNHIIPIENYDAYYDGYKNIARGKPTYVYQNDSSNTSDNGYTITSDEYSYSGTLESRPKNISVNYIIKATDVSNTTDLEDASIIINSKIEKNKNDILALNTDLEQHKKGVDDVVELFSSDVISGQQGTIKLTETWKNFRKITIEIQTVNAWRSVRTFYTPIISVDDTPTIGASKFKYMLESYGDYYLYMMFRSNNTDIFVENHTDYIHKILGIGRIAGF